MVAVVVAARDGRHRGEGAGARLRSLPGRARKGREGAAAERRCREGQRWTVGRVGGGSLNSEKDRIEDYIENEKERGSLNDNESHQHIAHSSKSHRQVGRGQAGREVDEPRP